MNRCSTCESKIRDNFFVLHQHFLKPIASTLVWIETEDICIMC